MSISASFSPFLRLVLNFSRSVSTRRATRTSSSTCNASLLASNSAWLGSNSKAPMPRCPRKHSFSTGFASSRFCSVSHAFSRVSPKRSGRQSANMPGKPLKVSSRLLPNRKTSSPPLALANGIMAGATSNPLRVNDRSNWNEARCRRSSHITSPTTFPQRITFACVTMCFWV